MIRINLVPQKRNRREQAVRNELFVVAAGLIVLVLILGVFHGVNVLRAASLSATNSSLDKEITEKQELLKQVKAAEEAERELQKKLAVIKELKAAKSGPVRMLEEIALAAPDKLRVTSINESDNLVKLAGIAASNEVISQFLSNLGRSPFFTEVLLIDIDKSENEGVDVQSFQLKARLVTVQGADNSETEGAGGGQ